MLQDTLENRFNRLIETNDPKKAQEFFDAKLAFTLGPEELLEEIKRGAENINIIDVRRSEDYKKSHIPHAINLPESQWKNLSALSKNKINIIYSYAQPCHLAARAASHFAKEGYSVMELIGGYAEWEELDRHLDRPREMV